MFTDFHLHTNFSFDCDTPIEAMIEASISKGIELICITDHYDFNYPRGDDFTMDIGAYLLKISEMQEKYGKQIKIYRGIEIGLDLQFAAEIDLLLQTYDFDYIIGSIHVIEGTEFYYGDYFKGRTKWEANQYYFEQVLACLKRFGQITTLGHLDYIARYGPNNKQPIEYEHHEQILDEIFQELINTEKILEINTSGIRQGVGVSFPNDAKLVRYHQLGGRMVVLGSDAHTPQDIGADFKAMRAMVEDIGLTLYLGIKDN
ncbi:MAG: histidinol-phosphatase HisJ family protein [Culicoidibacterales bacterium]